MFGLFGKAPSLARDHSACSGCSLCLLVCPVWRQTRDLMMTPHGRAKAMQHGATARDLANSANSCTLCGACEPVCPEEIAIVDMTLALRGELHRDVAAHARADVPAAPRFPILLLPDTALRQHPIAIQRIVRALGGEGSVAIAADDGSDIAEALESGIAIGDARRQDFLTALSGARQIIVADGLLLRWLRRERPRQKPISLGLALSRKAAVRGSLGAGDLYVIEPRAYHADHERLVKHYDELRRGTGCALNLDLQRMAIPARMRTGHSRHDDGAQTRWLLHGRSVSRIIVEDIGDIQAFRAVADRPVLHIAELA